MTMYALCSAKGSPGVTTSGLAFALTWRRRVILAECDPAGGDLAAGYLRETQLGERGLAQLAAAARRGRLADELWAQLVDLAPGPETALHRLVLPGLLDAAQAGAVAAVWEPLAGCLRSFGDGPDGYDVVVDCGRLAAAYPPFAVLDEADLALLVLRPTLPSVRAAAGAVEVLRARRAAPVALLLIGDGPYRAREISENIGAPVAAELPADPAAAAALSDGGVVHRGRLLRAAVHAERRLGELAVRLRERQHV